MASDDPDDVEPDTNGPTGGQVTTYVDHMDHLSLLFRGNGLDPEWVLAVLGQMLDPATASEAYTRWLATQMEAELDARRDRLPMRRRLVWGEFHQLVCSHLDVFEPERSNMPEVASLATILIRAQGSSSYLRHLLPDGDYESVRATRDAYRVMITALRHYIARLREYGAQSSGEGVSIIERLAVYELAEVVAGHLESHFLLSQDVPEESRPPFT